MATCLRVFASSNFRVLNLNFSTSSTVCNKWREKQGLEPNPRQYSPLNLLPDYSFLDGRPVPLSLRQKRKVQHQENLCKKIVELSHELDVGLEQYYKNQEEEKKRRETILRNKLKAKG